VCEVKPLNGLGVSIFFAKCLKGSSLAEVAQHGQRRRTEAPIPQGFVGSNPTLRTRTVFLVVEEESVALIHHLPVGIVVDCFFVSGSVAGCLLVEAFSTSVLQRKRLVAMLNRALPVKMARLRC
jgi:hypothetical protein